MEEKTYPLDGDLSKTEANTCMALGVGVGIMGAASAVLAGAVCPLCVVAAPGLIGYGAFKRWRSAKKSEHNAD